MPVSLYEVNTQFKNWRVLEPSYSELMRVAEDLQDTFVMIPIGDPNFTYFLRENKDKHEPFYIKGVGDLGVFFSSSNEARKKVIRKREGNSVIYRENIETPKGTVTATFRVDDRVATTWQVEPYIKSIEDIEKILSIPYDPVKVDLEPLKDAQKKLGDKGIIVLSVGDPLGLVVPLFKYERFLFFSLYKKEKVKELLDYFYERLLKLYRQVSEQVTEVIFRFWGPEYITPPSMSPKYFDEMVVEYDYKLIDTVKCHGNYACIHCHGRIRSVLEMIRSLRPDIIEPIEPPPYGDITLKELKRSVGDEICLMGYVEYEDIISVTPSAIKGIVRKAIEEGAPGGGYIMIPSSMPIKTSITRRVNDNFIAFLRWGRKLGKYPFLKN
ncbi:hypothetical protein CW702_00165 [Candidatus Bathyarchaeota archaeon]|nr:MAG: hypothetical protein CW702_00165 [Candidatus Bathyarchaeota archaeon]